MPLDRHLTFEQLENRCAMTFIVSAFELSIDDLFSTIEPERRGILNDGSTSQPAWLYASPPQSEPYMVTVEIVTTEPEEKLVSQTLDQALIAAWILSTIPQPTHPVIEEPELPPDDFPQPTHPVIEEGE